LSISKIKSFFPNKIAKLVQVLEFKLQKSRISFESFAGNSSFNHISSDAQIIQKDSTHLIFVFFIMTGSGSPCQNTLAQSLATATACSNSRFDHQHTICKFSLSQISTLHIFRLSASGCSSISLIFQ
jgi:hypothetical protein